MTALRLNYQTVEFGTIDVHLCTLRDTNEFHDQDGRGEEVGISEALWPLFGVVWPSSLVLANYLLEYDLGSKGILEVGCGMALSSLLLNKLNADITASDYHPEAKIFLDRNTSLNDDPSITFVRADWADANEELGLFDLIVGSDILYEDEHSKILANFISEHAKPSSEIIIVDPGRGRKNKFIKKMESFGFQSEQSKPDHTDYLDKPFKGHILKFERALVS